MRVRTTRGSGWTFRGACPCRNVHPLPRVVLTFISTPALHLLKAALDHVAAERREMVEEEQAVAVVGLVEEAARGESFGLALEPFAPRVLCAQARAQRAAQRRVNLADREAALLALLLALDREDSGVGDDEFDSLTIHHEEPQAQADLRRGQPHALRRVHRLEHVG